jgi:hypothetical protein
MMGDHRCISWDSRKFGPVDRSLHLRQGRIRLLADKGRGRGALGL